MPDAGRKQESGIKEKAPGAATSGASENVIKLGIDHMANANRQSLAPQADEIFCLTPEEALTARGITSLDQINDPLNCVASRLEAMATLLFVAVEDGSLVQKRMLDSVWLLQSQVEILIKLLGKPAERGQAA